MSLHKEVNDNMFSAHLNLLDVSSHSLTMEAILFFTIPSYFL